MAGHPNATIISSAIGLRLKKLCSENYTSKSECARALGMAPQNWSRIEAGRVKFDPDELYKYAAFFGVDPGWLLTGRGGEGKDASNPVAKQASESAKEPAKLSEPDFSPLDRLDAPPGSRRMKARPAPKAEGEWWVDSRPTWELRGKGAATSASGVVVQDQGYADDTIAPPEGITLVEVAGDSMAPLLLPGQYAVIDKERDGFEVNGGIVVVVTMNEKGDWETRVKRCYQQGDEYRFSSINKERHPTFTVKRAQCRIWPVLGVWFAGKGKPPKED